MPDATRRTLTYANVTATVALAIALGGTSVAAVRVGTADLRNGAVTRPKLAANAVTGAKVLDGSLRARDFRKGELPAGPAGPPGSAGGPGASGPPGKDGSEGSDGTARGYAMISPAGGPHLVAGKVRGFTAVARDGGADDGVWCITPAAGIDPATTPAVVSPERGDTMGTTGHVAYVLGTNQACAAGQFEVRTFRFDLAGGTLVPSDDVAFTMIVP